MRLRTGRVADADGRLIAKTTFMTTSVGSGDPHPPVRRHEAESCEAGVPVCWPSDQLLQGRSVVFIEHKGATYQLRLTRQDKLILTK